MPKTSPTILIVEEQLQELSSHHFEYLQDLAACARTNGYKVAILCNRRAPAQITNTLSAVACLWGVSDGTVKHLHGKLLRRLAICWGILANSWTIGRQLARLQRIELVMVPTAWWPHVVSLFPSALFLRQRARSIGLQFLCTWNPRSARSMRRLAWVRRMLVWLQSIHPRVCCFAQTQRALLELSGGSDLRVVWAPDVAHAAPAQNAVARIRASDLVVFGFYGFARHEQGADVLLEAIRIFLEAHPDLNVRFQVLWSGGTFPGLRGTMVGPDEGLEGTGKVKFFRSFLSREKLMELLLETDWVLLPYRSGSYARRSSRVAVDAACFGIPAIFSRGTHQEQLFGDFGAGIGVREEDPEDLARAFVAACEGKRAFRQQAQARAGKARAAYSSEAFWHVVFQSLEEETAFEVNSTQSKTRIPRRQAAKARDLAAPPEV